MANKTYWKGIQDQGNSNAPESNDQEFPESLPLLGSAAQDLTNKPSGRRDFLKMLGFSVSAAVVAASCEMPIRKSIPYVFKPEEITPGMHTYYASTYSKGGDVQSILVKTREGRPIKIEGNPSDLAATNGGTGSRVQASVLELYSNKRLQKPMIRNEKDELEESSWEQMDKEVMAALGSGAKVLLLTGSMASPSEKAAMAKLIEKYPNVEHVAYDATSYYGVTSAFMALTGSTQPAMPTYQFENADTIVSVNADFLGEWISPEQFAAAYISNRKVDENHTHMSRHIHIESRLSITGSNADDRIALRPSEQGLAVVYLYNKVAKATGNPAGPGVSFKTEGVADKLDAVAEELIAAKGKSLFVTGLNDTHVQYLGLAINHMLGNIGADKSVNLDFPTITKHGDDFAATEAIGKIGSSYKGLITYGCNPVYNMGLNLEEAGLSFHIAIGDKEDETNAEATHQCPSSHYLEAWGDSMPRTDMLLSQQPTIDRLFDTREAGEMALVWAGSDMNFQEFIRDNWKQNYVSLQSKYTTEELFWNNMIHDGIMHLDLVPSSGAAVTSVSSNPANSVVNFYKPGEGMELELYVKTGIGEGDYCDNPWSQELPDAISRATWDNYIMANKDWLESQELFDRTFYNDKRFMQMTLKTEDGQSITLPVIPIPGMQKDTLAVALGYGRSLTVKKPFFKFDTWNTDEDVDHIVGKNAYPLRRWNNTHKFYSNIVPNISFEKVEEKFAVATIQDNAHLTHETLGGEKTRLVVKETSLASFVEDPWAGNTIMGQRRDKWIEKHLTTLYGEHNQLGHHWGLSIDLNACTGCGACVTACHAENNVPVVGKEEVRRAHEMHWLRIDRYYTSDDNENAGVIFQPMMCQHCDNAPCENVCPVAATNHSSEGLNQMAYNRCIGTRYCANNCPYKVRRFNWFDYTGADSFYSGTIFDNDRDAANMMADLPRMVLNPDVTVRSRGVMEKCSFCVQRIQYGKLEAKKSGEPLQDGSIQSACQQACATNAIKFGDLNNPESEVAKNFASSRSFGVIEETHTMPTVNYLVKVRNAKIETLA